MEASFAPNRKHYPNLILDMKFMTPLTLEKLKVPMQVYIEGNISAGKSELLKHFEEKTNVITIPEPLTRWENFFGTDLLKLLAPRCERVNTQRACVPSERGFDGETA